MTKDETIEGLQSIIDRNENTLLPRVHIGYLIHAIKYLKEQEAIKPVLIEQTYRIWLCGKCGSYVGFEDNDPNEPKEFDKYCRECGKPVLWEGR